MFRERFQRNEVIDPVIEQYIREHGLDAMRRTSHDELCSTRAYVIHSCCEPNFGSSLFRMLAAVKGAMYFNKTFIVKADDRAKYYFNLPFMSVEELQHRMHWHQCDLNWAHESNDFQRIHFHANWHEIPPQMLETDDAVACDLSQRKDAGKPFREFFETYRCGDVNPANYKKHWFFEVTLFTASRISLFFVNTCFYV